eukprot:TRINITY_DN114093_c0_g1_i1.p1 TRINITY_DN114093_c0_g1~~TRINITY_DN114093_c0_g1_i1.p1  ORF type:complete len:217 (+),score=38.89 TRINITY_DN114093_c0_g1_i1:85-651(+)
MAALWQRRSHKLQRLYLHSRMTAAPLAAKIRAWRWQRSQKLQRRAFMESITRLSDFYVLQVQATFLKDWAAHQVETVVETEVAAPSMDEAPPTDEATLLKDWAAHQAGLPPEEAAREFEARLDKMGLRLDAYIELTDVIASTLLSVLPEGEAPQDERACFHGKHRSPLGLLRPASAGHVLQGLGRSPG